MRKATYEAFGPSSVLRIVEAPSPVPGPGEVLVAVRAAALNPKDVLVRKGKLRWLSGWRFPRGTGYDWAGEVLAIGPEVVDAHPGDLLYGMANGWAGGTVAERFVAKADECAAMPLGISFEEAAALPLAALTALQALRDIGQLGAGQRVALLGASGGVGVFAVQLARVFGAHVTASASARNLALLRDLGADEVMDYATMDPLSAGPYDLVFDIFGNRSFTQAEPAMAEHARYITTVPSALSVLERVRTLGRAQQSRFVMVHSRRKDLELLGNLCGRGALRPIIDSTYALEAIAAGHARIETKRCRGKVVIAISKPELTPAVAPA